MQANCQICKPAALRGLEYVLLMLCLCVLAIRATYAESPLVSPINIDRALSNEALTLITSTVLIGCVAIWCVSAFVYRKGVYRFSGIEIGLVLFFIAGVIGIFVASNKRAAVTDLVTLIAPMLMAVLLIQILDSPAKIKLVLFVVVALGASSSFQCFDELFASNQYMIDDYEKDPQAQLAVIGIEPGSFKHMLYEHRLYSRDIRGFLTTSNSAGSFGILAAFSAVALLVEKFGRRRKESSYAPLVFCGVVAVFVAAGLIVTQSKGAIIAAAISTVMLTTFLVFGRWLWVHRKAVAVFCLLAGVAGSAVVIWYGSVHERLPGGNSMLVRWQYWTSAAKMYSESPLTGIGGGNFAAYYPHYKLPEALESVRDPHNFILTLLTQYGPLGLIGFVAALLIVLCKTVFAATGENFRKPQTNDKAFQTLAGVGLLSIVGALLIFRPMLIAADLGRDTIVIIAVILSLYVVPAIVFGIAFLLLWLSETRSTSSECFTNSPMRAAVFCGIVAVLIHNLIDFAVFEPGVLTAFWVITACLVAIDFKSRGHREFVLGPSGIVRITAIAIALVVVWVHCRYALGPAVKAGAKIQQAMQNSNRAVEFLERAAEYDKLNPEALRLNGKLHLQYYNQMPDKQPVILKRAARYFAAAIQRDKADFKNYEKLMIIYELFAEVLPDEASDWNHKAYDMGIEAAKRYPGLGRLWLELGTIAERLGNSKTALVHYKEAVSIEDSYRVQFRQMYPGREMFSRLGEQKYQFAKARIIQLGE